MADDLADRGPDDAPDPPERRPEEPLGVRFDGCDAGWIRLAIPALTDMVIRATHLDDPFPAMLRWLEAICDGADTAGWAVNEEGTTARLVYVDKGPVWLGGDRQHLIHLCHGREVYALSAAPVERRALMREFYRAFRSFCDHGYRPDEWEPLVGVREALRLWTTEWRDDDDGRSGWYTTGDFEPHGYDGEPLRLLRSPRVEEYLREDESRQGVLPLDESRRHLSWWQREDGRGNS